MASIRQFVRRFLERPGSIDLAPFERIVRAAGAEEDRLRKAAELPSPSMDDLAGFCAVAREAADRALGLRPYDVQLVGALVMLSGNVAEMATGEGKTLSGAVAAAGYALRGRRVHVVSVNDYLARRDAEWMGPLYEALGVSVGWIGEASTPEERRAAYDRDVTYGSVSEIGFDVLRDRLRVDAADLLLPEPDVVLVDEADSVLVDEARVPLVLAGAADAGGAVPETAALVRRLVKGYHYEIDDQARNVHLTSKGIDTVEEALGVELYHDTARLTEVNLALHAHALLTRDVDYIVRDGRVHLVNPSRGRVALLQRWPDGLQAAVEAKEALAPSETGEILDSITVQGLITRYPGRCGMTGTAVAVGDELREFYDLKVAVVPPNRPPVRADEPDRLFEFAADRDRALVDEIAEAHATGRPILVGTLDVAESERLALNLAGRGLECAVLNAKNDAEEASIIARAGERGAITVSTQMAGRGTDIRLGEGVGALGGLYVIGSGRHASSRLDDQLRGRAGRQGDPGGSVFLVSGEDDLITHYVADEYSSGVPSARLVAHAQRVAEGVNAQIHRNTWRYTRLLERQRDLVLERRDRVLRGRTAGEALAAAAPERWTGLTGALPPETGEEILHGAARQIVLFHLDRCWAEHLAYLAELREGIHLRVLGRASPIDEFHKDAVAAYRRLLAEVESRSVATFESAGITEDGLDLDGEGLKRPTATWTYLVQENPFGSEWERLTNRLATKIRRR
ncbi:accessory Sec system translocase SecA2 [Planomonospora venezuelensis]|uniref:Protein translocase subunit SecA n=1 Tax=Planomonospora venezuelensis TaxID=1999 RepID=A0A841DCG1_PLAVE|nr:accessory Sec system translocase SecA2 [Planomonospora venezuelensis]MBB5967811.1 preprotein translocase subunit SecA [Planomonospora venezuelensis]GIN03233.1 protein translocase subunit SecA [Planomonospora venezuelensis]